jgi:uncharacterized protein (TIGR03067 family)
MDTIRSTGPIPREGAGPHIDSLVKLGQIGLTYPSEELAMKMRLLVVVAVGLLMAADETKDENKNEMERFQGTWTWVSIEDDGVKTPEKDFKDIKMVIKDDKFTVTGGGMSFSGTFKIDATKKPKTIDVTFSDAPEKGMTVKGIYTLEGDTYTVCTETKGKDRPTKFESEKDSGHVLQVLKREKK